MKLWSSFLVENQKDAKSHELAKEMGLAYRGFGYWFDPRVGKVTHKTDENGQLVPVTPEEQSNFEKKKQYDAADRVGAPPEVTGLEKMMSGGQGVGPAADMAQAPSDQEPENQAQKPVGFNQGQGWDPGPDGDTCVGGEEPKPEGIPKDTFVKKLGNSKDWTSGPDGSNLFNSSFNEWLEMNTTTLQEEDSNLTPNFQRRSDLINKLRNPAQQSDPERFTYRIGNNALNMMGDKSKEKALSGLGKTQPVSYKMTNQIGDHTKGLQANRNVEKLLSRYKDSKQVEQMNKDFAQFASDPEFDLDQEGGKLLGEGAFGSVRRVPGGVIKKGGIGRGELAALHALKDNPAFPTLLNARFDTPFVDESSFENNPYQDDEGRNTRGKYFDTANQSDWEKEFPTAQGTYAMTEMPGREIADAVYDMDEDDEEELMQKVWNLRAQMHRLGIAHNDMHGGNIYVDDEGNPSMLDLGLANNNPLDALMEGLGGMGGEDYQMFRRMVPENLTDDFRGRLTSGVEKVREAIMDRLEETDDDTAGRLETMMGGGIRMHDNDRQELLGNFPMLKDNNFVMELIKNLYSGLEEEEPGLEQRMSDAFDKRQADSRLIDIANKFRQEKGRPKISIRNKNVVPPENLDFDDNASIP